MIINYLDFCAFSWFDFHNMTWGEKLKLLPDMRNKSFQGSNQSQVEYSALC